MATPLSPRAVRAAITAAFLSGAGLGGSGYVPHLVVKGDAPASGAHCEVVGPMLDGQRICTPDDTGWGTPMEPQVVATPDAGQE